MDLLNQKILFNPKFNNYNYYKNYDLPVPVFFSIPTLAFHVCINRVNEKRNFIQETILYMKRNGVPKNEISEQLCLDQRLVDVIIENSKKDLHDGEDEEEVIIEKEEKSEDFYIFYDLITNQFIEGYMYSKFFNEFCCPMNMSELNLQKKCYYLRENIGDSSYTKIHMLSMDDGIFKKRVVPTIENIISCYKDEKLFDETSYRNARYLNESYPIWLTLGYSVTKYNSNEYSIINPFKYELSYSTYFNNIVKMVATDEYSKKDIKEYQENANNSLIKHQNEKMDIRTNKEKTAFEGLAKKYGPYGYFKENHVESKFERQMIKMQSTYDYIKKNTEKEDCNDSIRRLYDFANNVLEQLFIITYEPYILKLPDQLKKENFFDAIGREKTIAGEKMVLENFFDDIKTNYDFTPIINGCYLTNIVKCIKSKSFIYEKSFKLGLINLFTLNVINIFYNKNSKFSNLFKTNIPHLIETVVLLENLRQSVRHTFDNVGDFVDDVISNVYLIIDTILEVSEERTIELSKDENDDYSNFIGQYQDLDNMTLILQESCNQLLMDIYNTSELYYSDCVIAFQNTSKVILDYIMRKINSIGELEDILKNIPNDNDEAKILLMEKLEYLNINVEFDNITIDIENAKNCMLRNFDFRKASTLIVFAPLLLAVFDYMSFITLFEQLGAEYFNDAISSINNRGHDSQSTDWDHIKLINDKYVNYCKILTLFEREEL